MRKLALHGRRVIAELDPGGRTKDLVEKGLGTVRAIKAWNHHAGSRRLVATCVFELKIISQLLNIQILKKMHLATRVFDTPYF